MKMIIGAFCDQAAAQEAASYVRTRGSAAQQVQLLTYQDDVLGTLRSHNIPRERIDVYAEVMRRGAPLLVARVDDNAADDIANELDRRGSLDLDAAEQRWRAAGWSGFDANAIPLDESACAEERGQLARESIPVVEEKVVVGKRAVERGVRIRTFVTEQPVREDVELRDEHIEVSREATNEPLSSTAADAAFHEDEYVVTATGEEAVVGKEARVVERVHVGKTAETRTETIEETERRQDVEVQELPETETRPRR